jgi:WhiB family redox-sensing transcriptional regulator
VAAVATAEDAGERMSGWQLDAACRQLPTELFFPVGHGPRAQAQTRLAKEVCRSCAVRNECLDYALAANLRYGVFGGLAEDERREVRRRQRRGFPVLAVGLEASA